MIAYLIVILSAGIASYIAWRYSPLRSFLSVYLPLLIFIPSNNGITTHGVLIIPAVAASLAIVIFMFLRPETPIRWCLTDAIVILFVAEAVLGEYRIGRDFSAAGADFVQNLFLVIPNYFMGRYLLEAKGARVTVLKRLVFLFFVVACISPFEYRMGMNPFFLIFSRIFNIPFIFMQQFRWGFARVAGPFGHAILAGIVLISALMFQLWLSANGHWEKKMRLPSFMGGGPLPGKKASIITAGLIAGVWMTQSRGPWMGGALGFILYLASRAKRIKQGITKAILVSVVLFAVFYVVTDKYTDPGGGPVTPDQENAVYRRYLITNYMPVVEAGGMFGFGRYFPTIDGQASIDNFYLLTALVSGYAGFGLFVLLIAVTSVKLIHTARNARSREDAGFAICLLSITAGTAVTLTTVFLGAQAFPFFFLICGWSQAIDPRKATHATPEAQMQALPVQRFAYRRVFS